MSLDVWMKDVRRLSAAVSQPRTIPSEVSLSHLASQPPGKPLRVLWRASCCMTAVEADTAEAAMARLLVKLTEMVDERIKSHKDEIAKLQDARRNGLKVADAG